MFLVRDTIEQRHTRIRRFLNSDDAPIAVLLAATDFERTIRRAILGLGRSPTKEIRKTLLNETFHGLEKFKKGWQQEVKPVHFASLAEDVVGNWSAFRDAFELRHRLIHGSTRPLSSDMARNAATLILVASRQVHDFAIAKGVNLDGIIRRFKARHI